MLWLLSGPQGFTCWIVLKVSFSDCEPCLTLSYFFTYAIFYLQQLGKSREMRVVFRHKERKGVELSHAIGTFLINDV